MLRRFPSLGLLGLSSCFIITSDDIRRHDRKLNEPEDTGDADTDTDSDSDSDTDTDADTDTNNPDAPGVTSFTAQVTVDYISLSFSLEDPNGDLDNGQVRFLEDGVDQGTFALEGLGWDGVNAWINRSERFPCDGLVRDYAIVPIDAAGNEGLPSNLQVVVEGHPLVEGAEPAALGLITFPAVICGQHDNYDIYGYPDDTDNASFESASTNVWRMSLVHDQSNDRDLLLYTEDFSDVTPADEGYYPESVSYFFFARPYHLSVTQDMFMPGEYRIYFTQ